MRYPRDIAAPTNNQRRPGIGSRIVGALVGGGGAYAMLTITGAWELPQVGIIAIASGMVLAGLVLGPVVWRAVIELV